TFSLPHEGEEMPATGELIKDGKFYVFTAAANGEEGIYMTISNGTDGGSFHVLTQWLFQGVVKDISYGDLISVSTITGMTTSGAMGADANSNSVVTMGEMEAWLNKKSADNLFDMDNDGVDEYQMRPQVYPNNDSFELFVKR
ncbi:MAG: hypothetical protein IJ381_06200, partial [Clostridia bacterium]|nr:hypothetical protein [Clostridia bacterium]